MKGIREEYYDEKLLELYTQIHIYAMQKKKVWGKDREYFVTVKELEKLFKKFMESIDDNN